MALREKAGSDFGGSRRCFPEAMARGFSAAFVSGSAAAFPRFGLIDVESAPMPGADGKPTVLTIVSEDNFSIIQRTLLLQFTLLE